MKLSEMKERKVQWLTVDDEILQKSNLSYDNDDWMVVEPQRIRVFSVEYVLGGHLSQNTLFLQ